jgi:protein involved in polysaccharide export with SLBB domain
MLFGRGFIAAQTPTPESVSENQAFQKPIAEENLIHIGDLIDVDVVGSLEYDWRGVLTDEGFLSFVNYSENRIYALCRDEDAVALDVAKSLSKFLRQPKVVVKIIDRSSRPASVLYGAVKTPQRFRIKRPVFLNELIISSGGFTEKVSGEIQIFRPKNFNCLEEAKAKNNPNDGQGSSEKYIAASQDIGSQYINVKIGDLISGKKEANPQILSGDIITVSEAETVYVVGGVVNPKQISLRSQITVSRAIDSAGGLTKDALAQNVKIFRRENKNRKIIEVDLTKAKTNPAEDVILEASDIVEVAQRGRGDRKYPPIIKAAELNEKNAAELPLRIID